MSTPIQRQLEIFNAALERPAGPERDAYLAEACAGDDDLRRCVEDLLSGHSQAGTFLVKAAGSVGPTVTHLLPVTEKPGDKIGRYKLLQQIGEGGCGVVYMAEQEEPVRRRVALKVIRLGMDTKSVVARFEAERQALALMDHPNIAKVFDGGATESGRPYFVMELVRGIKITEYCDQAHLSTGERLKLFIQVCQAVQHAHQKGIIHRDIKPSNILVTVNDGVAVPKVIDFGIAKATDQRLTDKSYFTEFHAFIGTPAYTSPEQAEMSSLDIDTRSDIYSLGVLLYEMLTGQTPFPAERLLQSGLDEMRRIIREEEPPRPSTRLTTLGLAEATDLSQKRQAKIPQLASAVQGDLDWIVMKALEKDRTRRYETANGFAADLQRHLNHEAVLARPPTLAYKFQRAVRRNKGPFAAAAAVFLTLLTGIALTAWQAVRASRAEHAARTDRDRALLAESNAIASARAEREAKEAEASNRKQAQEATAYLINALRSPDPSRDGLSITVAELLDRNSKELEGKLQNDPRTKARLFNTLARAYSGLGLVEKALPLLERTAELLALAEGEGGRETLAAKQELALEYWAAGKPEKALPLAEFLYRTRLASLGADHPDTVLALMAIGNYLFALGRHDEGLAKFEAGFKRLTARWGENHVEMFWPTTGLADKYRVMGRIEDAFKLAEPVLQRRRARLGSDHPDTLHSMRDVANDYIALGREADALILLQETVANSKKRLGLAHHLTISATRTLIRVLIHQKDLINAEKFCREALNFVGEQPDRLVRAQLPRLWQQLYDILASQQRWSEAETAARQMTSTSAGTPVSQEANYDLARALYFQNKITQKEMIGQSAATPLSARNSLTGPELLRSLADTTNDLPWARTLVQAGIQYRSRQEVDGSWNVVIGTKEFTDCSVLAQANISRLNLDRTAVTNLSPLKSVPLRALNIMRTGVHDLTPLRGVPLVELLFINTPVTDVSPLRDTKLEKLQCNKHTTDLSPLQNLPLTELQIGSCTNLTDFSPLASIKTLERLLLPPNATDIEFLRQLPKLKRISFKWDMTVHRPAQTAEEFWAEYDARKTQ